MSDKKHKVIAGLTFFEDNGEHMHDAFGIDHDMYHKTQLEYASFLFKHAIDHVFGDRDEHEEVDESQIFAQFLETEQFKKMNWPLTPNGWFVLHMIMNSGIEAVEKMLGGMHDNMHTDEEDDEEEAHHHHHKQTVSGIKISGSLPKNLSKEAKKKLMHKILGDLFDNE